VPLGPGFAEFGDYEGLMRKVLDVRRGAEFVVRDMVMPNLRRTYDELLQVNADVIVSHPLTVTAPLVAEKRGLPWASTVLSPMSLMSAWDPPLIAGAEWLRAFRHLGRGPYAMIFGFLKMVLYRWEAPLRAFRRSIGLPPQPALAMLEGQFSPHLNLALFDPPLAAPQPDWPSGLRVTGAPLHDGIESPEGLEEFLGAGEPPLVFALGSSAVWVAGDFWQRAVDAANQLGHRALLIVGRDTPARLPSLGDRVRAFAYVPYSRVFPRAAAVIHQAGIGTLSQAMRSGRPQLIVPFAFDQPDNARRAAALGVARMLARRSMADELAELLGNPDYEARARRLAAQLSKVNGAEAAADALIALS
jgi:rhamnosyltransferase subunit B